MNHKTFFLSLCLFALSNSAFAWVYYHRYTHPSQILQQAVPFSGPANPYGFYSSPYGPAVNPYDPRSLRNSPQYHTPVYDQNGNIIGQLNQNNIMQQGPYFPYRTPFPSASPASPYSHLLP